MESFNESIVICPNLFCGEVFKGAELPVHRQPNGEVCQMHGEEVGIGIEVRTQVLRDVIVQ
jgi:hypothetical protein